jgi:hypothetical protein
MKKDKNDQATVWGAPKTWPGCINRYYPDNHLSLNPDDVNVRIFTCTIGFRCRRKLVACPVKLL